MIPFDYTLNHAVPQLRSYLERRADQSPDPDSVYAYVLIVDDIAALLAQSACATSDLMAQVLSTLASSGVVNKDDEVYPQIAALKPPTPTVPSEVLAAAERLGDSLRKVRESSETADDDSRSQDVIRRFLKGLNEKVLVSAEAAPFATVPFHDFNGIAR